MIEFILEVEYFLILLNNLQAVQIETKRLSVNTFYRVKIIEVIRANRMPELNFKDEIQQMIFEVMNYTKIIPIYCN